VFTCVCIVCVICVLIVFVYNLCVYVYLFICVFIVCTMFKIVCDYSVFYVQCVTLTSDLQEVMVNVGDVGKDYEHGVQLLKKLGEFRGTGAGVSVCVCVCVCMCVSSPSLLVYNTDMCFSPNQ